MDQIVEQMRKLSITDNPLPLLNEIKTILIALSTRDLNDVFGISQNLTLIEPIFDFLNSNNNEQILICIDVLGFILSRINPCIGLECFLSHYILCLSHPNDNVSLLALKQIHICSSDLRAATLLLRNSSVLLLIINKLSNSHLEIVKLSQEILLNLCSHPQAVTQVLNSEALECFKNIMQISSSCRFHVYDLAVRLCSVNNECLNAMALSGILNRLVDEIFGNDVLSQMNALELLSTMAVHPGSFKILKIDGIVNKLSRLLVTAQSDPMASIILPGVLKFFGHLGSVHPQILVEEESHSLRETLHLACDFSSSSEGLLLPLIAFETLCHIGSNIEGKIALKKLDAEIKQTFGIFFSHMSSFPTDMKVRSLESLAKLFHLPVSEQTEDLVQQMELWFSYLSSEPPLGKLFSLARQPFPEILCSTLSVIHSLTSFAWGIRYLSQEPGMFEWLLNRDSCRDKESKELRFAIVSQIHRSDFSHRDILSEDLISNIATFYSQGPFYVPTESLVTFERNV